MKVSGEHFEDRIVEVCWDSVAEGWKMMRFRDDKPAGNHLKTVESVILSIRDGVEKETVLIPRNAEVDDASLTPLILFSCLRNAGLSGRLGKPDTTNQTNRPDLLHTTVRDRRTSPPVPPSSDPYHLPTPNLRIRTQFPTCKRVTPNLNNTRSRTLRRACKASSASRKPR